MLLLEIKRQVFLPLLQTVANIVEKRANQPILANILIEYKNSNLSVTSMDQDIQITASCSDKSFQATDFALTVSAKKIVDIFRVLPETETVFLENSDHQLLIRTKKSRFHLQTLPANDYPLVILPAEQANHIRIEQKILKQHIAKVQFAMAQQDFRYYLNGMLFNVLSNQIELVATDGHRLSWANLPELENPVPGEWIVPRKTILELFKLLKDESEQFVDIAIYSKQICFELNGIQIISKLIDGKFPDYNKVIPKNHTNVMQVERLEFLQSLQRVAILSTEKFRGIRFILSQNELKIISNNNEQEEAQELLFVQYQGIPLDIGFNVTYLLEFLSAIDTNHVLCHFNDANSSMLITLPERDDFKYVVMSMRI